MPVCKSCGSPLRFDIASQMLHCSYCDNNYDPYDFTDDTLADESSDPHRLSQDWGGSAEISGFDEVAGSDKFSQNLGGSAENSGFGELAGSDRFSQNLGGSGENKGTGEMSGPDSLSRNAGESADDRKAAGGKEYDVTIFTCPNCGAQLGSTETSAAEFCSFCGSPVVLESRLCRIKKPDYIIPFQQTRESSAQKLQEDLKKKLFISGDFRNAQVEKFRGIYMPCWNYHVKQEGECSLRLVEEKDNYRYNYALTAHVDADYRGIPHDASESFSDYISEMLEPYNYKKRKPFVSSFLAGFFSDIQDVDESVYEKDACLIAARHTKEEFLKDYKIQHGEPQDIKERNLPETFFTRLEKTECTLIPVWFLSYRMKNRVAYAAVNGESGKVVSDAPLSIGKIWACAAVLAIPLFILLNMFLSMKATSLILPANFLLAIVSLIYYFELDHIEERDKNANWQHAQREADRAGRAKNKRSGRKEKAKSIRKSIGLVFLFFCFAVPIFSAVFIGLTLAVTVLVFIVIAAALLGAVVVSVAGILKFRKQGFLTILGFAALIAAGLYTDFIYFLDPISDVSYYAAAIIDLAAILFALTNILQGLNKLTTRPLPQFRSRGGEEHEQVR